MFLDIKRKREIDKVVSSILTETGLSMPSNSLNELCKRLNIKIGASKLLNSGDSGVAFNDDYGALIVVNKKDSVVRQYFTLAHELGHIILGHIEKGKNSAIFRSQYFDYSEDTPARRYEMEANYFAAVLLVPEKELFWALDKSNNDINVVAKYFGV